MKSAFYYNIRFWHCDFQYLSALRPPILDEDGDNNDNDEPNVDLKEWRQVISQLVIMQHVAVHLGVKMADTLSFTAKVDMVDF